MFFPSVSPSGIYLPNIFYLRQKNIENGTLNARELIKDLTADKDIELYMIPDLKCRLMTIILSDTTMGVEYPKNEEETTGQ